MARVRMKYFGLEMTAEGRDELVARECDAFREYIQKAGTLAQIRAREEARRGLSGGGPVRSDSVERDVVVIYDDVGIPSIMHRFRRVTNKELFGGSDQVHPAFIIGGEVYNEIFISVYPNTMINGRPYSLPFMKPATNITMEDFAAACFSKGEGWHCLTAAEWGLLANESLRLGTLPHGNTNGGSWHGDAGETGTPDERGGMTLAGSGPATWTHNHKPTGVHDLCGNIWEFARGLRIKNGMLQAARNNDAALPGTDLTESGDDWVPVADKAGTPIYVSIEGGKVVFNTGEDCKEGFDGCRWGDVETRCESECAKELAMFAGETDAYCYVDSTEGEYILIRGGVWYHGANAGVFASYLSIARSRSHVYVGGRSAYFVKHSTPDAEARIVKR